MRTAPLLRPRRSAAALVVSLTALAVAGTASAAGSGTITHYKGHAISGPGAITLGPDKAIWFSNDADSIGRITVKGKARAFTSKKIKDPRGIVTGADHALWFLNFQNGSVGRLTTRGKITIYHHKGIHGPESMAAGPHRTLWFTTSGHKIGRVTTKGKITLFHNSGVNDPQGIAAGPDGAMWFTDYYADAIGRVTSKGKFTFYPIPGLHPIAPAFITAGPGGLWFTDGNNTIGRITT